MAKLIGYWDDNPEGCYDEGPFVCVVMPMNCRHARIECEVKGRAMSGLLHLSVYKLLQALFGDEHPTLVEDTKKRVDYLNDHVKLGRIILKENVWVVRGNYGEGAK